MGVRKGSPIDVIEAAYAVERTPDEWMRGIVGASAPMLDQGPGLIAMLYDASDPRRMNVHAMLTPNDAIAADVAAIVAGLDEEYVARSYRSLTCALATETLGIERTDFRRLQARGIVDLLGINGFDPSGWGFFIGALRRSRRPVTERQRDLWSRVAAHVASGHRLRRRLARGPSAADAVVSPSGKIEHAEGEAKEAPARAALRAAVRAIERARGGLRRAAPEDAVAGWKGLVAARWTLLDDYEEAGKRYVLARRNDVTLGGLDELTTRERQALAYAALGHGNKMIAYEMGIASSTVGVLLHRAAKKLGARTRADLVRKLVEHARGGSGP